MKDLILSKKFQAAIIAVIVQIAAKYGLELDEVQTLALISPLLAFIIGQAAADMGKEKAVVETEAKVAAVKVETETKVAATVKNEQIKLESKKLDLAILKATE